MNILLDEGFMFGIGLFETIAVAGGHAIFLNEHMTRINAGLQTLGIQKQINGEQVLYYIQKERIQDGVVKIMVSEKNTVFTKRENPYTKTQFQKGFKIKKSTVKRNVTSPFTYLKSFHYGDNFFEKKRVQACGFDEPIFLNEQGQICEGATTNLFFIQKGEIYTPPVHCGLLNGIMRQYILRTYPVTEKILTMDQISELEAIFLTNSLLGIMPVSEFEEQTFLYHEQIHTIRNEYEQMKFQL